MDKPMKHYTKLSTTRLALAATFAAYVALGRNVPAAAQQETTKAAPRAEMRLYTLDCGFTEFKDADVFSDTGEYAGKYIAMPTPCYLIKHGKDWLLWDTGLGDKLAS